MEINTNLTIEVTGVLVCHVAFPTPVKVTQVALPKGTSRLLAEVSLGLRVSVYDDRRLPEDLLFPPLSFFFFLLF